MELLPRTQPTQAAAPVLRTDSTAFKAAHKPKLTMIWVTEIVGDRARLVARWTTQD